MTDYKAVKIIRNGCEYLFNTGGEKELQYVDIMVIAGGGAGGTACSGVGAGGGGAGGVIIEEKVPIDLGTGIIVGAGGNAACYSCACTDLNGCPSTFGKYVAVGGGAGGGYYCPGVGGSGGGAKTIACYGACAAEGGLGISGLGYSGGTSTTTYCCCGCFSGGGGGGAGGDGCAGIFYYGRGHGGRGIYSNFNGTYCCYAGGGGGNRGGGQYGGGDGSDTGNGCPGTTYGSGGGGTATSCKSGNGYQGVVMVRYPADGSYGIEDAIGGIKTCATIDGIDYCIHTFNTIGCDMFMTKSSSCYFKYLVVGGGGGGATALNSSCYYNQGGGGGGGDVICGATEIKKKSYCIIIGNGGAVNCRGCNSCIEGIVCANGGGCGNNMWLGGDGMYKNKSVYRHPGGAGAGGIGGYGQITATGGLGLYGYGGGGGGGDQYINGDNNKGCDGGGNGGSYNRYATSGTDGTGGGGGGGSNCYLNGCKGGSGRVEICYKTDGSTGINCATGGTVTTSGCWTIHTFTSNGTFTIVS